MPLVKGIEPPAELFQVEAGKVVGLTIDAQRLSEIRGERIRWMRGDRKYASLVEIYEELEYAAQVHRRLGCPILEVSELLDRGDLAPHHRARRAAEMKRSPRIAER